VKSLDGAIRLTSVSFQAVKPMPRFHQGLQYVTVMHHLVVPFRVGVISSVYFPYLHWMKVVWDPAWWSFPHPSDVFNDVTYAGITSKVLYSQLAHCPVPVHLKQWLHRLNLPIRNGGSSCTLIILGSILTLAKDILSPRDSLLWWCIVTCFLQTIPTQPHTVTKCPCFDPVVFKISNR
jgi:hypothetical protein